MVHPRPDQPEVRRRNVKFTVKSCGSAHAFCAECKPEAVKFQDPVARFLEKVVTPRNALVDCWIWNAGRTSDGYGSFLRSGRGTTMLAHRWSYEFVIGAVPDGLEIDHLCRNRACVNPFHLEATSHQENVRRGDAGRHFADMSHCVKGHEFSKDNTYRRGTTRQCRQCILDRGKQYRADGRKR